MATVIASKVGGSDIDSATDKRKFRYMAVAGPAGLKAGRLIKLEADALRTAGWSHITFQRTISSRTTPRFPGLNSFGAGGGLGARSPSGKAFVDFELITTHLTELDATNGTPIYDAHPITRSVSGHHSVLFVQLGWTNPHES